MKLLVDPDQECTYIEVGQEWEYAEVGRLTRETLGVKRLPRGWKIRAIPALERTEEQPLSNVEEYHRFEPCTATIDDVEGIVFQKDEYVLKFKEYRGPQKEEEQGPQGRRKIGYK